MLDLDASREEVPPRHAATLVIVRDRGPGMEVFCVERHKKSAFLGGAIVFPGGKLDDQDADSAWDALLGPAADALSRSLMIAACRESLEEAAIFPVRGPLTHEELVELRSLVKIQPLFNLLAARGLVPDLRALHPFARWVTPVAENRRFDTRFFMTVAPHGQPGAHDDDETTSSFWARPTEILARFDRHEVQLAPPTHRMLEVLATAQSSRDAVLSCASANLDPICPRLVRQEDTLALVLPGDPEHDVHDVRVSGTSRFVLRGERWLPENPKGP